MTLLCEDANSKLVEVATVADVELRNVLTMVWCRFGSWSLVIKSFFVQTSSTRFGQNFEVLRQDFEAEVAADPWLRLWRLFLVEILRLRLVKILKFKISRNADIWLMFWSCCLVEIMKMKSNQDLFENLWYDLKKLLWWAELNPRVRCAFGNVFKTGEVVHKLNNFTKNVTNFITLWYPKGRFHEGGHRSGEKRLRRETWSSQY